MNNPNGAMIVTNNQLCVKNEDPAIYGELTATPNELARGLPQAFTYTDEEIIAKGIAICEARLRVYGQAFHDTETTTKFFKLQLMNLKSERFDVLFLTTQHQMIENVTMFYGTIDGASVYPREVVKMALKLNAAAVIFAHNHPSGICNPSSADIAITKRLTNALDLIGCRVLDHIIIAGSEHYLFSGNGLI